MALEISTVGAHVKYCVVAAGTARPSTGYTELPNVSSAPEFDMDVEALDASDITDTITRYIAGRQDPGTDATITLNHTDAVIDAWESLVTSAQGKEVWWEYAYPNATHSYYWKGQPVALGNAGIEQNAVDTIPAKVIPQGGNCWDDAST